jgi:hypothetical protein
MGLEVIRWKRSSDGFAESHCGRWRITPEYWSCVEPQAFTLHRDGKIVARGCSTQRDAKDTASDLLAKEIRQ